MYKKDPLKKWILFHCLHLRFEIPLAKSSHPKGGINHNHLNV